MPRSAGSPSTARRSTPPAGASPTTPATTWPRQAGRRRPQGDGDARLAHARRRRPGCRRSASAVHGRLDWDRRHALMRTHTALHVLCGVIWNEWGKCRSPAGTWSRCRPAWTSSSIRCPRASGPGRGAGQRRAGRRPPDRGVVPARATRRVEDERADPHQGQPRPRVGARDPRRRHRRPRQAGRRRHPRRSTGEVGRIRVVKTESKGKGNKRIRIEVLDA